MDPFSALREIANLNENRIDLIHLHTPFIARHVAIKASRVHSIPLIETQHTLFEEYLHHYIPLLPRKLGSKLARSLSVRNQGHFDGFVVPSVEMQRRLIEYGCTRPINIVPTGIEADQFRASDPNGFRRRHGIRSDQPVLLFVGRLAHEKNIELLISMTAIVKRSLPDVLLIVAGEGPATRPLKGLAKKLGVRENVRFMGYLRDREDLANCYACADLFVFGSRTETQGLVLLEALAAGTPALCVSEMGTRDIVDSCTSVMDAPPEAGPFAQRCLSILTDHDLLRSLHENTSQDIQNWTAEKLTAKMSAFYQEVVSTRRGIPHEFATT
jgi:1,2-diacylglycerol 3-alpha-glucosyltransferase